jgi:hypothetical protein
VVGASGEQIEPLPQPRTAVSASGRDE